jgi:SAM-dependent methyltransferase
MAVFGSTGESLMSNAEYRNHAHYIREGWNSEPKESFKELLAIIRNEAPDVRQILDVGCATGELLGFLSSQLPNAGCVGVDVTDDLLTTARGKLPRAEFVNASALDLPEVFAQRFDLTCAIGCMSIFDETQIEVFWANLIRVTTPGGLIVVLSPLNEFGIDAMIRHRKRVDGKPLQWETGWNIFSKETITGIVETHSASLRLQRFQISLDLKPKDDPIRTWTMRTEHRDRQLTNGLKLLVDHYFMIVRV